jgi:uncharacterized protein YlxW (UPF0749 family)
MCCDSPVNGSLDHQLTDGYARALAIEAECLGTMRRIAAAAAAAADDETETSQEVKQLAARLGTLQAELKALRTELDERRRSVDPYGRLY